MRKCQIYPICFGTGHGYRFTPKSNDDTEIVCELLEVETPADLQQGFFDSKAAEILLSHPDLQVMATEHEKKLVTSVQLNNFRESSSSR